MDTINISDKQTHIILLKVLLWDSNNLKSTLSNVVSGLEAEIFDNCRPFYLKWLNRVVDLMGEKYEPHISNFEYPNTEEFSDIFYRIKTQSILENITLIEEKIKNKVDRLENLSIYEQEIRLAPDFLREISENLDSFIKRGARDEVTEVKYKLSDEDLIGLKVGLSKSLGIFCTKEDRKICENKKFEEKHLQSLKEMIKETIHLEARESTDTLIANVKTMIDPLKKGMEKICTSTPPRNLKEFLLRVAENLTVPLGIENLRSFFREYLIWLGVLWEKRTYLWFLAWLVVGLTILVAFIFSIIILIYKIPEAISFTRNFILKLISAVGQ